MRGGKPGESELVWQGETDSPLPVWGWSEVQAPHNHQQPPGTLTPNLNL